MKKILGVLLLVVLAVGFVPMVAGADCTPETGVGKVCAEDGVILLDGDDNNPEVAGQDLGGSITINTNNGQICVDGDDPGDPDYDPDCSPALG